MENVQVELEQKQGEPKAERRGKVTYSFPFDHDNVQSVSAGTQEGFIIPSICPLHANSSASLVYGQKIVHPFARRPQG